MITTLDDRPSTSEKKKGRSASCESTPPENFENCANPLVLYWASLQALVGLIVITLQLINTHEFSLIVLYSAQNKFKT